MVGYLLNMNNQEKVSVTAVPFNPQTQSFTPAQPTQAIAPAAPVVPNMPTPNPTITADNLGVQKINVPGTQPATVKSYRDNPDGTTTNTLSDGTTSTVRYTKNADGSLSPVEVDTPVNTVNQAEDIIQKTSQQETEAQKTDRSLGRMIFDIAPNLQGQTAFEDSEAKRLGRDEKMAQLNSLNNEIRFKEAELRQDGTKLIQSIQNIEDKPIAMEFITGQQQSVTRNAQIARALKASEIDVLNARAIGLQGDISLAESMAKKAVETKYAPYKELLETIRLQQEALKPTLAADEKKQLREQEIKTKLAFNDIAKREKNETDITSMVVQASSQGAPSALVEKARLAKTPSEAASILGAYAGDYWGTKIKIAQYGKIMSENAKIASEVAAGGLGATSPVDKVDQAKFLIDTIAKANSKADAAGRSAGRRMAETWLVGSTDYTDLESQVRTLKTNLLTLAADPNVKKILWTSNDK